jgi:hypothetical protein
MAGVIDHVNVTLKIDALLLRSLDLSTPQDQLLLNFLETLSNGTTSGKASQMWHDTRTLAASANEDLDFAASLANAFGVTLTFATIKCIVVRAKSTNTNNVQVTRPANGVPLFMASGDGISLGPGEWFAFFSPTTGKTVTAGTGDLLNIANSAGSTGVDYDIVVIGTD